MKLHTLLEEGVGFILIVLCPFIRIRLYRLDVAIMQYYGSTCNTECKILYSFRRRRYAVL